MDLFFEVFMGNITALASLSKNQLEVRDGRGMSLLHTAIEKRQPEIAKLLVKKGLDVNAAAYDGYTPLIAAVAAAKDASLTNLLLTHGADTKTKYQGQTPLEWAIGNGAGDDVIRLLKGSAEQLASHAASTKPAVKEVASAVHPSFPKIEHAATQRNAVRVFEDDERSNLDALPTLIKKLWSLPGNLGDRALATLCYDGYIMLPSSVANSADAHARAVIAAAEALLKETNGELSFSDVDLVVGGMCGSVKRARKSDELAHALDELRIGLNHVPIPQAHWDSKRKDWIAKLRELALVIRAECRPESAAPTPRGAGEQTSTTARQEKTESEAAVPKEIEKKSGQIRITCPSCSKVAYAPLEAVGRKGKCPRCKRELLLTQDVISIV